MPRHRAPVLVPYSCPLHPGKLMICQACLGQRGGRRSTRAKTAAARRNWKKQQAAVAANRARRKAAEAELNRFMAEG